MSECVAISNIRTFSDLLVWPNTCTFYFYLVIFLVLVAIVGWFVYKREKKDVGRGNLVSSYAVTLLAFSFLAVMASLIHGDTGVLATIALFPSDNLLYMFALTVLFILMWIFGKRD